MNGACILVDPNNASTFRALFATWRSIILSFVLNGKGQPSFKARSSCHLNVGETPDQRPWLREVGCWILKGAHRWSMMLCLTTTKINMYPKHWNHFQKESSLPSIIFEGYKLSVSFRGEYHILQSPPSQHVWYLKCSPKHPSWSMGIPVGRWESQLVDGSIWKMYHPLADVFPMVPWGCVGVTRSMDAFVYLSKAFCLYNTMQ